MKKTKIIAFSGNIKLAKTIKVNLYKFDAMSAKELKYYLKYEAIDKNEIQTIKELLKKKT
ncbi:MAG: hypothetical protein LBB95_00455 [Mycoplasmataceae bacterium]|jgi:hypothetical protein|nr:hypothetical protein [Mycoplasmataceae bacterium]